MGKHVLRSNCEFRLFQVFPTLTHGFITAVVRLIELPDNIICFILSTLQAPFHFCVGRGVVREILFHPAAGIGQGVPFSPVLFSFCVSFVLYGFDCVDNVEAFLYADDLGALITGRRVEDTVQQIVELMKPLAFSQASFSKWESAASLLRGLYLQGIRGTWRQLHRGTYCAGS